MAVTRVNAVLYLTKTFFDFYALGMSNTLRYTFPADTIQNLDIVTPENLMQQLQAFIQTNKLPAASILLLLSDELLFCKELPVPATGVNTAQDQEITTFLDVVPFDHLLNKLYKLEKKEIIVATNMDYFTRFQEGFKTNNSRIEEVVPVFLLGKTVNLQSGMPQDIAHIILEKLGNIKPWSMPISQEIARPVAAAPAVESKQTQEDEDNIPTPRPQKKSNKRVLLLSSGMLPLIAIFLFMLFQMNAENAKQDALFKAKQQAAQVQPTAVPTLAVDTTDQSTSAFSATADEQNLKVNIEYSQASASLAASIKSDLTDFGIKSVQDISEATANTGNTVTFSSSVSEGTQQRIVDEIHKFIADVNVQNDDQMSGDVLITLP